MATSQTTDRDRERTGPEMDRVTFRAPRSQIEQLENRVDDGEFANRSEAIRTAIRELNREG